MGAVAGLVEQELGPARDHLLAERDEQRQQVLQIHGLRPAGIQRQHVGREIRLQRRETIELVEDDVGHRIALQLDDDAHSILVGLVAQRADSLELAFLHQLRHVRNELGLVDLVRQLGDDDLGLARRFLFLDDGTRAHHDASASGLLVILDSGAAVDVSAGREVGTLDQLSDVAGSHLRIVDQRREGGDDFTEVVRWDVGRHADRDSRGSVDDEIGNGRGKSKSGGQNKAPMRLPPRPGSSNQFA